MPVHKGVAERSSGTTRSRTRAGLNVFLSQLAKQTGGRLRLHGTMKTHSVIVSSQPGAGERRKGAKLTDYQRSVLGSQGISL